MVLEEIKNRRSVRKYKVDQVKNEDLLEIIKAAQFAPTSRGNRAVEFIVIRDQATKEELYKLAEPRQDFLKQAPVLIIPVIDSEKSRLPQIDLALATENTFLQATALGLSSVWKNTYSEVAEEIKKILHLPDKYILINILPVGYAQESIKPYGQEDFDQDKIHFEKW